MFVEEGQEQLLALEKALTQLEREPEDTAAITEIFRIYHTLKGMAGMLGLTDLEKMFHRSETLLQEVKDERISVSKVLLDFLFRGLDVTEQVMHELEEKSDVPAELIQKYLKKLITFDFSAGKPLEDEEEELKKARMREIFEEYGIEVMAADEIDFSDETKKYFLIHVDISQEVKLKTTRVLVIIKYLAGEDAIGNIIRTFPPISDLISGNFELDFELIYQSEHAAKDIKDRILLSDEIESVDVKEIDAEKARARLEQASERAQIKQDIQEFQKLGRIKNIRVDVSKLDEIMEIIGELLINTKQVDEFVSAHNIVDLKDQIQVIQKLMLMMQENIVQMQLVPVSSIFRRYPRMIRSLARQENKDVKLVIKGAEMLIDRKILDEINEALIHLIRNAVSHGIEPMAARPSLGKPKKGRLVLHAYQEKNMLVIEVSDDGRGINVESVKDIALEHGLITEREAETFSEDDAFNLIFEPGFSTRGDEVSEVSGRGIGLNIVREKAERLGGLVNLSSTEGDGTTFTLMLPLSMSIIKALLVRVGQEIFSIPLDDVAYISMVNRSDVQEISGTRLISFNEKKYPVYDLSQLFNIELDRPGRLIDDQNLNVCFIEKGNRRFCLVIEEFMEQTEIVVKKIEQLQKNVRGISGATILNDGTVSLILDPFTIVI